MLDARGHRRIRLALWPPPHGHEGRSNRDDAGPDNRFEEYERAHPPEMDDAAPATIPG
jgi:hypothetical protein